MKKPFSIPTSNDRAEAQKFLKEVVFGKSLQGLFRNVRSGGGLRFTNAQNIAIFNLARDCGVPPSVLIARVVGILTLIEPRDGGQKERSKTVPKSRKAAIAYSQVLVDTFDEALTVNKGRHHNRPPSALRIEDPQYLSDLQELRDEIRRVNALLRKRTANPKKETAAAIEWAKHLNVFLESFSKRSGTVLGVGIAGLLIATTAALLNEVGVTPPFIKSVWSSLKLPK